MSRLPSLDSLFDEQRRLQADASRIHQRLTEINQQILYLLARHAQMETLRERPVTVVSQRAASPAAKGANRATGSGTQRKKWFARGETAQWIGRVVKGSMRPAEVVHAVMEAKGYAGTLAAPDRKKAEAALHQAIIAAVRTKLLVRDAKGFVRVGRA